MNYPEKRKSIRVPVDLPSSFDHSGNHYTGRVMNLSVDGCFLQSGELLHAGEIIDLIFRIPAQEMEIKGKIMWVGSADKSSPSFGMGIHFENATPSHHEALETFIQELLKN